MKKLNFAVLLAMFTFMGGGKSYAHDIEVANADGVTIYYNFINDQTELEVTASPESYADKVVIPESVAHEGETYPVTSIGNNAFSYCFDLTEVAIPNSVTSIGESAFSGCYNSLTEVTIGNSVTSIGNWAFSGCYGLTELTIPNSVTSIGDFAFRDCIGLTELTIPNSVTSIGGWAFNQCRGLTKLTIGNSVISIGEQAFCACGGLEEIIVESGNPIYDSREDCNAIIETNSNELIYGCKGTIIPNTVTSIGDHAFDMCNSLTELTIPNSVTSIGESAFSNCIGLTKLTIGNSVTSIGKDAFFNCIGLTELTIPNSVTSIGESAFFFCDGLTTLYSLNTTPPSVGDTWPFQTKHYTNVDLFVPSEALEAYQTAEIWKEFQKLHAIDATAIAKVSAAEQIQAANGQITVTGLTDGTTVTVYDLSGKQVGTATSKGGQATVNTGMTAGATVIVKTGEKSVKTVMK